MNQLRKDLEATRSMSIFQLLHAVGLNPFAVQLLAESMLKSPHVAQSVGKPISFEFPVHRGDCPGYIGVRITIEPIPAAASTQLEKCDGDHGGPPCKDPNCWNDSP